MIQGSRQQRRNHARWHASWLAFESAITAVADEKLAGFAVMPSALWKLPQLPPHDGVISSDASFEARDT